jgi:hypothetical protein
MSAINSADAYKAYQQYAMQTAADKGAAAGAGAVDQSAQTAAPTYGSFPSQVSVQSAKSAVRGRQVSPLAACRTCSLRCKQRIQQQTERSASMRSLHAGASAGRSRLPAPLRAPDLKPTPLSRRACAAAPQAAVYGGAFGNAGFGAAGQMPDPSTRMFGQSEYAAYNQEALKQATQVRELLETPHMRPRTRPLCMPGRLSRRTGPPRCRP